MSDPDQIDPDLSNNFVLVETAVNQGQADLALTKTAPGSAAIGDQITYTLTITNNGPTTAFNSAVTETLPSGVTVVGSTGGFCDTSNPPVVTCVFGAIPSGDSVVWTITVDTDVLPAGDITNSAEVFLFFQVDPSSVNNTVSATTTLLPQA